MDRDTIRDIINDHEHSIPTGLLELIVAKICHASGGWDDSNEKALSSNVLLDGETGVKVESEKPKGINLKDFLGDEVRMKYVN